jgi:membrane-associated phospholipid phosphatase
MVVATTMRTDAAGEPAPSAGAGKVGWARQLGRWLARCWFRAPDGRMYQRRRADALVVAVGLGVVVVCGVLVANRLVAGPDLAVFRRINHWPGWLYPPMWTVQLSGVIGALPLVAAAAALLRRLRLAAALAAATLLKVPLEAVAKTFVQRGRPAETVSEVILRGKAAAHGLSFPSGHAMVIFTIAALAAPYFKSWWKVLPGPWPPRSACRVCISGRTFPWTSPRGRVWACSSGGVLNLAFGVPSASSGTAPANGLR